MEAEVSVVWLIADIKVTRLIKEVTSCKVKSRETSYRHTVWTKCCQTLIRQWPHVENIHISNISKFKSNSSKPALLNRNNSLTLSISYSTISRKNLIPALSETVSTSFWSTEHTRFTWRSRLTHTTTSTIGAARWLQQEVKILSSRLRHLVDFFSKQNQRETKQKTNQREV